MPISEAEFRDHSNRLSNVERSSAEAREAHSEIKHMMAVQNEVLAKISGTQDSIVSRLADGARRMDSHDENIRKLEDFKLVLETTGKNANWFAAKMATLGAVISIVIGWAIHWFAAQPMR